MNKITNKLIELAYQVAKDFYNNRKTLQEAKSILVENGMNENSAMDYIYNY